MGALFLVGGSVNFFALFLTWSTAAVVDIDADCLSISSTAFVLSLLSTFAFFTTQLEQYHGSGRLSGFT